MKSQIGGKHLVNTPGTHKEKSELYLCFAMCYAVNGVKKMIHTQTDKELFEKIYMQQKSKMVWIATQVLQNAEEAEDAVHTAFVTIANNFAYIRDRSEMDIQNYALKAAKNAALNMRRTETMGS